MASELFDSKYCAIKAQAVPGTYELPALSDSLLLLNGDSQIQADYFEQEVANSTLETNERTETRRYGYIEGDLRLVGHPTAGTAGPVDFALQLAGHTATTTITPNIVRRYKPFSKPTLRASGRWHQDSEFSHFKDCMAILNNITMNMDEICKGRWRMEGGFHAVGDQTHPTGTYPNLQSALANQTANTIFKIDGIELAMYQLELTLNAKLQGLPDTKLYETFLAERKPVGVIRLKKEQLSLFDWYGIGNSKLPVMFAQQTPGDLSKGFRFNAPLCQFGIPKKIDRSKQFAYEVEIRPNKVLGDDAYSFDLGDVALT